MAHKPTLFLTSHSSSFNIHSVHSTIEDARKIGSQLFQYQAEKGEEEENKPSCYEIVCVIRCTIQYTIHRDEGDEKKEGKKQGKKQGKKKKKKVKDPEIYNFTYGMSREDFGDMELLCQGMPIPETFPSNSIFVVAFGYSGAAYLECFTDGKVALSHIQELHEKLPHFKNRLWSNVCLDCSVCNSSQTKVEEAKLKSVIYAF